MTSQSTYTNNKINPSKGGVGDMTPQDVKKRIRNEAALTPACSEAALVTVAPEQRGIKAP